MAAEERYVTATGLRGLTRFYDSIIAVTMREQLFRGRLSRPGSGRPARRGAHRRRRCRHRHLRDRARRRGTRGADGGCRRRRPRGAGDRPAKEGAAARRVEAGPGRTSCRWPTAAATGSTMSLLLHHLDAERQARRPGRGPPRAPPRRQPPHRRLGQAAGPADAGRPLHPGDLRRLRRHPRPRRRPPAAASSKPPASARSAATTDCAPPGEVSSCSARAVGMTESNALRHG